MRREVVGMNGSTNTDTIDSTSNRLDSTVFRRVAFAGSFASFQGSVSSIYLLARPINCQISLIAPLMSMFSIMAR